MTVQRRCVALACAIFCTLPQAWADSYPDHPVRIVVPYTPGGSTDLIARIIAEPLGRALGKPVIVDNKSGAGGMLGTQELVRSAPDGYTLGIGTVSTMVIFPAVHPKPGYSIDQIWPITNIATMPNVVAVRPNFPAKDLKELIALLKANPGKYSFATSGQGSINHMLGESFQAGAGVDINHIPYRGSGPAMQDVMAGQVDILFDQLPSSKNFIDSGKLGLLGVISPSRLAEYPQAMTMEEVGIKGLKDPAWYGLIAPAKLPVEVQARLVKAMKEVMAMPDVKARLSKIGAVPFGNSASEYSAQINQEIARMKVLVRERKISLEE
jgi:tripartite-type tricarboxylate transporter receptor subunit TctC